MSTIELSTNSNGPDAPELATVVAAVRRRSPFRTFLRRLTRHPTGVIGLVVLLLFLVTAIFAPWLAPHDPNKQNLLEGDLWITSRHWLGTDRFGRDVLSRLIYGARPALIAPAIAVGVAALLGIPLGIISGYLGGKADWLLGRAADAAMSVPSIVFAVSVIAVLGPSLINAMLAVGLIYAPRLYRVTRAATLALRHETFVEASVAVGGSRWRIMRVHILPNIASTLLVQLTLMMGFAILAEASLSFLGLSMQPPAASWGSMLRSAAENNYSAPSQVYPPGVAIVVAVLAFNLVGDALNDALGRQSRGAG